MGKISGLFWKKRNKILMFLFLDIFTIIFSSIFAIWLRFDFGVVDHIYLVNVLKFLAIDAILLIGIFFYLRLYTSIWQYASVTELVNIVIGCISFEAFQFLYKALFSISMPRSFYVIQLLIITIMVIGTRFSYRVMRSIIMRLENRKREKQVNTMVIGAGDAGRLLIYEIQNDKVGFDNRIVCVIDDNIERKNTYIRGIPIVGGRHQIKSACEKYNVEEIIIAIPSATKTDIAAIVDECQKTKCKVKILPRISTMVNSGRELVSNIKELSYEDFLGRDQIVTDVREITANIQNQVILVTGGGGSIGSELCRQIAKCNPKMLIIFDIYENNAYDIEQELVRNYPGLNLKTIIGSVRDYDRLEKVFKEYNPDQVFHAAAHKHVPLMEVSPNEAIKNNCLGTLNAAKLADIYKVKKFVLISTDKAVRPTNIMGASKRICEMIIQSYDKMSKNTDYVAVRFGNVLGSNGSVIPLFLKQIENGGPVTVTHKDITRFFMTIPEAVSLVLQASVYAKGGEIFILDMGEPVKIYDLAKKLIRYKGYEPDKDIKIEITGLRPGEKLYEEILMDEEGLKETPNKLIHIGQPIEMDDKKFLKDLDKLIDAAYKNKDDIKDKVAKIVTTYKVDKR